MIIELLRCSIIIILFWYEILHIKKGLCKDKIKNMSQKQKTRQKRVFQVHTL